MRAAVIALVVVAAACGHASFEPTDPMSVESALTGTGAEICGKGTADSRFQGETSATWYELSSDCAGGSAGLTAGVIAFDSEGARNGAYTDTVHRMRRLSNHAVFTYGDSVVVLTQIRDRQLLQDVATSLRDAGAK